MELDIVKRLRKSKNTSDGLKNLRLSKIAVNWIKSAVSKEVYLDAEQLAKHIKSFELPVVGLRPIDEVISTVGGIDMNELDNTFQLNKLPKVYCVGEMLDWDAPTGGFLIQGAVSSGAKAANAIVNLDRCAED
jgi:predicted flavoprotein YhiN